MGVLGVLGFWGFGVLGFWGFGVLGFWGFGVLGFWGFGVLGFWGFGVLGFLGFWVFGFLGFGFWVLGLRRQESTPHPLAHGCAGGCGVCVTQNQPTPVLPYPSVLGFRFPKV